VVVVIWTFGWITEFERRVNVPCVNPIFVSFAHRLLVCNRRLGSGKADLEGEPDFVGDAEDRLTGLFVGEGGFSSISTYGFTYWAQSWWLERVLDQYLADVVTPNFQSEDRSGAWNYAFGRHVKFGQTS
jgi:hypothetical protein